MLVSIVVLTWVAIHPVAATRYHGRMFRPSRLGLLTAASLLLSCARSPAPLPAPAAGSTPPVVAASGPLVIFLGDSLTAGFGLPEEQAFPALIQSTLARRGRPIRVVNAGVSGDTTAGGLARLDWLLAQRPDILVVGLGANDGLRGQPVASAADNLGAIVRRSQGAGVRVLLLGMQVPRSLGAEYAEAFASIYPRLAREQGVPLVPFLLEGVAGVRELNLEDGIHPTAPGHRRLAETVLPYLERMLESAWS